MLIEQRSQERTAGFSIPATTLTRKQAELDVSRVFTVGSDHAQRTVGANGPLLAQY
jgi:hypothetical protein